MYSSHELHLAMIFLNATVCIHQQMTDKYSDYSKLPKCTMSCEFTLSMRVFIWWAWFGWWNSIGLRWYLVRPHCELPIESCKFPESIRKPFNWETILLIEEKSIQSPKQTHSVEISVEWFEILGSVGIRCYLWEFFGQWKNIGVCLFDWRLNGASGESAALTDHTGHSCIAFVSYRINMSK